MKIIFPIIEEANLLSYYYFSSQLSNNNLHELNSFRVRNILSLVLNKEIKDIVLEDLFSYNGTILSVETRDNLYKYLSEDERFEMMNCLSKYLDCQLESNWFNTIIKYSNNKNISSILIPTYILNNDIILMQLNILFTNKKFVDWHTYDEKNEALIIDYNHAWKKRSILTIKNSKTVALFLSHFFENIYKWKLYNEERHFFNRMNTQTRNLLIGKDILLSIKGKLALLRPQNSLNEWDVLHESIHKNSFNPQEEVVIHFNQKNSNKYKFGASFLLINDGLFTIENAKNLANNPEKFEGKFKFSNLENIISQIDLGELNKAIEKDNSINLIIQPLWSKFNLNEKDGRLWKQLLFLKAKKYGVDKIFSEIESISGVKQFISLNTFKNAYCNPENNTIIPREKRIFKAICQYLELPFEYRAAIHRERNLIGGHSQELHSKLKDLIKVIVQYGILDKHQNDDALLEILNNTIDSIYKNVDVDFFGFTKDSLLYACIALCYEIIDKMNQKPIIKIEHIFPN